jgi:hypothetical protein
MINVNWISYMLSCELIGHFPHEHRRFRVRFRNDFPQIRETGFCFLRRGFPRAVIILWIALNHIRDAIQTVQLRFEVFLHISEERIKNPPSRAAEGLSQDIFGFAWGFPDEKNTAWERPPSDYLICASLIQIASPT